jgi:lysozyme
LSAPQRYPIVVISISRQVIQETSDMSTTFLKGIDVSHFQGSIDWSKVAAQDIAFAYAKASEGNTVTDPCFVANYQGIKAAGMRRGAYHFLHANVAAADQVKHFLSLLGPVQPGDLPPMLDVETACGMECAAIASCALDWLNQVREALSCTPLIYSSRGFWNENLAGSAALAAFPLWIAEYTSAAAPALPTGVSNYLIWQHSQSGTVAGIAGAVDLDVFNGSPAALAQMAAAPR